MTALYQFDLRLTLQGPILAKSSTPASFGLDAAVARDFQTGRPMIPGTLLEGRVRESLSQLGEGEPDSLFGRETGANTDNMPDRGKLLIGDILAESKGADSAFASRVALDGTLGSAKGEMLRVIETPFLAGEEVVFAGVAEMFCRDDQDDKDADGTARLLRVGLLWQTQFGALRTTGFGKVLGAEVTPRRAKVKLTEIAGAPLALELAIRPLGPLCVARHKIGDNLFESEITIPGNMLAGAVMETARALEIESGFNGEFDKIRFRHAFPTVSERRPRALPLSTVKAGKILYDVAACREPVLLHNGERFVAPEFPVDWKDPGDALGALDWARPARELRVRTAIDIRRRKGDDGKLFAWEMVHPFLDDAGKTTVVWRSRIDLSKVEDESKRAAVAKTLGQALAHLSFVSKTKTRCEVVATLVSEAPTAPELENGDTLALVLQTPALLADPRFQGVDGLPKSGAIPAADMLALYRATFAEISENSLTLGHHFAQQHLEGGNYLGIRFQKKHQRPYNPWLLTDAGSVFVFAVKDAEKAKKKIAAWLDTGLPVPAWAKAAFGKTWSENPYRPQNGFGEVAIHEPKFATPQCEPVALADPILPPSEKAAATA